ncbi:MAG: response regulator [Alphaproteobacteria bacterium]
MTPTHLLRFLDHHSLLTFGVAASLIAAVTLIMIGRKLLTRIRRAETELEQLRNRIGAIYAAVPFGICAIEDDKRIVSNEKFNTLLRPLMKTVSSNQTSARTKPGEPDAGDLAVINYLRHEDHDRVVNLDGENSILIRSIRVPGSRYRVATVANVTERMRLQTESAEAKAKAELASLVNTEFSARMSREIRTAVSGIVGMVDLACDDGISERQAGYLQRIHESAYSILEVVDDLLGLSRVGTANPQAAAPSIAISAHGASPPPPHTERNTERILVAEDNPINREVIEGQLAKLGYECEVTGGGEQAFERWLSGRFALLLTDCEMPGVSGFELARRIRAEELAKGLPRTPIVAITANVMPSDRERCRSSGMDDYLAKPFSLGQLRKVIDARLGRAISSAASQEHAEEVTSTAQLNEGQPEDRHASPAVLDLSLLREIYPDNESRIGQLIARFLAIADEIAGDIDRLADQRNGDELADASHKLKSSALTSGAFALAEVCGTLEEAGRDLDWLTISVARHQLGPELERVRRAIGASAGS